jgi:hypothetical protein
MVHVMNSDLEAWRADIEPGKPLRESRNLSEPKDRFQSSSRLPLKAPWAVAEGRRSLAR